MSERANVAQSLAARAPTTPPATMRPRGLSTATGGGSKPRKAWQQELDSDAVIESEAATRAFEQLQRDDEQRRQLEAAALEAEAVARRQAEADAAAARAAAIAARPRVRLEIGHAPLKTHYLHTRPEPLGALELELYSDVAPRAVANMVALVDGSHGVGYSGLPLSLINNPFHRIVPGFMAQAGDITHEDGTGGESIYGRSFDDEDLSVPLDRRGLVALANSGPNTNNSQFFITFDAAPWLDGKHVVFGRVLDGFDVLDMIEKAGSPSGRPLRRITIVACSVLRQAGASASSATTTATSSSSSSTASDAAAGTPKRRPTKRKREKAHSDSDSEYEDDDDDEQGADEGLDSRASTRAASGDGDAVADGAGDTTAAVESAGAREGSDADANDTDDAHEHKRQRRH